MSALSHLAAERDFPHLSRNAFESLMSAVDCRTAVKKKFIKIANFCEHCSGEYQIKITSKAIKTELK